MTAREEPRDDERALTQALHRRAGALGDAHPLELDDVRRSAGALRRRRRVALVAGLTAGAVVLVPLGVVGVRSLGGGSDARPDPVAVSEPTSSPGSSEPTSPTPSTSATAQPSRQPSREPSREPSASTGEPFDLAGLADGATPAISWVDTAGDVMHRADGSTVEGVLPADLLAFAPMATGWMFATTGSEADASVGYVGPDGSPGPRSYPMEGALTRSPGGQVVAWVGPDGVPTVVQGGGIERYELPAISAPGPYSAVAVTSDDCVEGRTTPAGCSVYVNTLGEQAQAWASAAHGFADVVSDRIRTLTAARESVLAGITDVAEDGSTCSVVLRTGEKQPLWETCDHRITGISPDGAHVSGVGTIGDGQSDTQVTIRDAEDGEVLVDRVSTRTTPVGVFQLTWEDADHLLAVVYADQAWSVVRIGVDGAMEYAVAPRPGSDLERPFYLTS